jgi:hypothetical protein
MSGGHGIDRERIDSVVFEPGRNRTDQRSVLYQRHQQHADRFDPDGMAESRGLLKILSRPRVVTQNNIQAVVKQGTKVPS